MANDVFFDFSMGLAEPLTVPRGTKAAILEHVEEVEETLGLKRSKYEDNPVHWDHFDDAYRAGFPDVDAKVLCETVENHNAWVRQMWANLDKWAANPIEDGEQLTPEDAQEFWHGFQRLTVEPARWTREYYRARMEHLYEVMRGRPSEGVTFDAKALTTKQAAQVINIFSFLDPDDLRLDVPHGHDYLASSYDGGYDWCGKCGRAIAEGDSWACKRRGCELKD